MALTKQNLAISTTADRRFLAAWLISFVVAIVALIIVALDATTDGGDPSGAIVTLAFMTMIAAGTSTICVPCFWFDYRWRQNQKADLQCEPILRWKCSPKMWRAFAESEKEDGRQAYRAVPVFVVLGLMISLLCLLFGNAPASARAYQAVIIFVGFSGLGLLLATIHFVEQSIRAYRLGGQEPTVAIGESGFSLGNSFHSWRNVSAIELKLRPIPHIEAVFRVFNGHHTVDVQRKIPVAASHLQDVQTFLAAHHGLSA